MTSTHHMNGGSKGALYRETRQATGSYVVRIVIATAEFAPMPPHWPGYPGGLILTAIRMRFSRHGGIYLVRCGMKTKPQAGSRAASRRSAPNPGSRACREDRAPSHRPQMSSGRLFLDRGARQQSPSPLHRQLHPKTVPGWGTMKWQRTVNSVLTICLSKRGKRKVFLRAYLPSIYRISQDPRTSVRHRSAEQTATTSTCQLPCSSTGSLSLLRRST